MMLGEKRLQQNSPVLPVSVLHLKSLHEPRRFTAVVLLLFSLLLYLISRPRHVESWRAWDLGELFPSRPSVDAAWKSQPRTLAEYRQAFQEAKSLHLQLQRSQSRTIAAAREGYQQRTGRSPPVGFDAWFHYAQANGYLFPDRFFQLEKAVEPFWRMSGAEYRQKLTYMESMAASGIVTVQAGSDGHVSIPSVDQDGAEPQFRSQGFAEMLRAIPTPLPFNVTFPVNEFSWPRVVAVPEAHRLVESDGDDQNPDDPAIWTTFNKLYAQYCADSSRTIPDYAAGSAAQAMPDFCRHPAMQTRHGLFGLETLYFQSHVPLLSPSTIDGTGDISIPAHYYFTDYPHYTYVPEFDMPWNAKDNTLLWRGSNSGTQRNGVVQVNSGHRQRFVHQASRIKSDLETVSRANISVGFYTFEECGPPIKEEACSELKATYQTLPTGPFAETWHSRLAVDIDGWSYSARFRALLQSNSLVIKHTIFSEWFSDFIMPYAHYVPMDLEFSILRNVVDIFMPEDVNSQGSLLAQEIAKEGQTFAETAMRRIDMVIYIWRLALEMGALESRD